MPKPDWTHEAHLIVALWHLYEYDYEEAPKRMRQAIRGYNQTAGSIITPASGYHETLAVYWLRLLHAYHIEVGPGCFDEAMTQWLHMIWIERAQRLLAARRLDGSYRAGNFWSLLMCVPKPQTPVAQA